MKTRQTSLPKLLSAVIAVQLLLCPWSDARQVPASDTSVSVAVTLKLEGDAKPSRMTLQLAELRAGPSPSRVTVRNMQLSPGANTFTLPIGHYRVVPPSDVNPGTFGMPFGYELKSMRSGTTDLVREPFELLKANAAHIEMTIGPVSKPAGIRPLNLVNIPGRFTSEMETVEGIVAVEGGGPAPFFCVQLAGAPITRSQQVRGSTFQIPMPRGSYQVSVLDLPADYAVESIMDGGFDLSKWSLIVFTSPNMPNRFTVTVRKVAPRQ